MSHAITANSTARLYDVKTEVWTNIGNLVGAIPIQDAKAVFAFTNNGLVGTFEIDNSEDDDSDIFDDLKSDNVSAPSLGFYRYDLYMQDSPGSLSLNSIQEYGMYGPKKEASEPNDPAPVNGWGAWSYRHSKWVMNTTEDFFQDGTVFAIVVNETLNPLFWTHDTPTRR
mgnify:CR=1 FL=1